jgi:hypothetical protein
LAGAIDDNNSIGLSAGEIRNIEGLAREERELRAQLSELQLARDATRARVTDLQGRAARAPLLVQQYQALSENLTLAEASHAAALDDRRVLEYDYDILVERDLPPVLLSEPPYVPEPVEATRTRSIVVAGLLLGVLCIGAVVVAVERVDRRVLGARSIVAINGKLPLAEIPIIPEPPFAPARVG